MGAEEQAVALADRATPLDRPRPVFNPRSVFARLPEAGWEKQAAALPSHSPAV